MNSWDARVSLPGQLYRLNVSKYNLKCSEIREHFSQCLSGFLKYSTLFKNAVKYQPLVVFIEQFFSPLSQALYELLKCNHNIKEAIERYCCNGKTSQGEKHWGSREGNGRDGHFEIRISKVSEGQSNPITLVRSLIIFIANNFFLFLSLYFQMYQRLFKYKLVIPLVPPFS